MVLRCSFFNYYNRNFTNSFTSKLNPDVAYRSSSQSITIENETWLYDTFEEFLAEYPKATRFRLEYYQEPAEGNVC